MNTSFEKYTYKARFTKSLNTLTGIIEGISIDGQVNATEIAMLRNWLENHSNVANIHPYNQLIPILYSSLEDGIIDPEERNDILWVCEKLQSTDYYCQTTAGIQRLHGILGAIAADSIITKDELIGLAEWLEEHDHLRKCWPFDEVESLVTSTLQDGKIDDNEHKALLQFFTDFSESLDETNIDRNSLKSLTVKGVCASCPEIVFDNSVFCFTGLSSTHSRQDLSKIVQSLGGIFSNTVTKKTKYLVIGADGNQCWAYSCYGRKVEQAVKLRMGGSSLLIIHENDFHDAVLDRQSS